MVMNETLPRDMRIPVKLGVLLALLAFAAFIGMFNVNGRDHRLS